MILWVFVYISISLQKLSVAWVAFNLFIPVNNEAFGLGKVTFSSCLLQGMSESISFQGFFLTVFFSLEPNLL